jgi:hypothetical protein
MEAFIDKTKKLLAAHDVVNDLIIDEMKDDSAQIHFKDGLYKFRMSFYYRKNDYMIVTTIYRENQKRYVQSFDSFTVDTYIKQLNDCITFYRK